ncbi:hypothetical protein KBB68_04125 [Candidatus Babeliales bacterium]|nr:hypothetical protein [Candidatus Babeliales bacterium]
MKKNTLWLKVAAILTIGQIINGCSVSQDCSSSCSSEPCSSSKNTWFPRAFSSDASREITLEKTVFQNESDHRDEWNGTFSFATQYMQNFGAKCNNCKNLGSLPFWGANGTNSMTYGNNDGRADIDAYNFGLGNVSVDSDGIGGTISINPNVTQVGTDFMLYFVHKKDEHGMYFKIHAPLGAISVNPQMTVTGEGAVDTSAFSAATITNPTNITYNTNYPSLANRPQTLASAFAGGLGDDKSLNGLRTPYQGQLLYGKIATCKQTEIRLADLSFVLGYNVLANEKGFFGLGFKTTCPTGNVPSAQYMLEPIMGRGGNWGVGADIMGHYKAWENDTKTKYCDIWFQGEVLHLLPGRTGLRSFDLLANGKGSKYILLQHYHQDNIVTGTQYVAGSLTQAINVTTLPVYSKFSVEGAAALMLDYHCNNWNLAVSGEFWGRTKETLSIDICSAIQLGRENLNHYAVVGRQASAFNVITNTTLAGVAGTGVGAVLAVTPLAQPAATINNSLTTNSLASANANANVLPTFNLPATSTGLVDGSDPANRIPEDLNEALDICGAAAAKAFTGKVFAQFGYTWNDARYTPNLSFIGSAEFTNATNNAVQMWSAGLQGSINF